MSNKFFWWLLLILQPVLYGIFTQIGKLPYYEVAFFASFTLSWASVVGLWYGYNYNKKSSKPIKVKTFRVFISTAAGIGVIGYISYFGGYFFFPIFYVSLVAFFVTLIFTAIKLVFIFKEK